ncbi:bifunctional 4-hydroxy-2-oxoglutarate aldolase/2-dehydro-3-deoxy-phosphogluconate aldolase [Actinoalloteichus sp. GBA129-24]|uniref:bifunctional 4-hydroxy-2-oxoglutarate aldolase/2-dehydro-3-deoxy-phosphogluconate aldolase n=1 Tax=Actinoalloteichus sp. GBA129-24 TaxID=1612551 RepID=UPI00095072BA|nr:bifunctional 4-hydroxy-2-oxoglutarate aldolase/2-dehydro-3-deoxy-phosphogluconate aldolase [Actinoalloteichus sp. GBA129-24]APU21994.1 Entner-Doudoroff aldolase [Actinoalloteichus sp. GBA129-24]
MTPASATRPSAAGLAEALAAVPVIAIIRLPDARTVRPVATALRAGGVRAMEITLTTDGALDAIRALRDDEADGRVVGAGSVRTPADATAAVRAGARFLVTPTFRPAVLDVARSAGVPVVCGAMTPTELDSAAEAGADYLKLFPASAVGPRYLREVLAPMPELRIVPTGGVRPQDVAEWAAAGAHAVAAGGALVSADLAAARDWAALTERADRFVRAWPSPKPAAP